MQNSVQAIRAKGHNSNTKHLQCLVVNLATQPLHKGNLSAGICKSGALHFGSLNLYSVNYLIICQNNQSIKAAKRLIFIMAKMETCQNYRSAAQKPLSAIKILFLA